MTLLVAPQDIPMLNDQVALVLDLIEVVKRVALATALGLMVTGCWWYSTRQRTRIPGLGSTLILLAVLISFVTLSVGSSAATAFTLVGTLAIVRFRTAIRDMRDAAFVIFAVAAGIAAARMDPIQALPATATVALLSLGVTLLARSGAAAMTAGGPTLEIRFEGASADLVAVEAMLRARTDAFALVEARAGSDGGGRLVYAVNIANERIAALMDAARALPGVRRASLVIERAERDAD
jgi:hypothetical protein